MFGGKKQQKAQRQRVQKAVTNRRLDNQMKAATQADRTARRLAKSQQRAMKAQQRAMKAAKAAKGKKGWF